MDSVRSLGHVKAQAVIRQPVTEDVRNLSLPKPCKVLDSQIGIRKDFSLIFFFTDSIILPIIHAIYLQCNDTLIAKQASEA